jgi:hypothetical protein
VLDDKRLKYRKNTFCTAAASCGTGYVTRVTELCEIQEADSLVSEISIEKETIGGDDCLVQASAPSNLQLPVLDIRTEEVKVEWVPSPVGTVAMVKAPGSVPDEDVIMCYPDCLRETYPACVFTGECDLGADLEVVSPFCPPDAASNPPECLWNYECNFTNYKVEQKEISAVESIWQVSPSCAVVTPRESRSCIVKDLDANTQYQFRVSEECFAPKANSPPSDATSTIRTLPKTATIWRVYAKEVVGTGASARDVELPWSTVFESSASAILYADHLCQENLTAGYTIIDDEIDTLEGSATFGQQVNYLRFNF